MFRLDGWVVISAMVVVLGTSQSPAKVNAAWEQEVVVYEREEGGTRYRSQGACVRVWLHSNESTIPALHFYTNAEGVVSLNMTDSVYRIDVGAYKLGFVSDCDSSYKPDNGDLNPMDLC